MLGDKMVKMIEYLKILLCAEQKFELGNEIPGWYTDFLSMQERIKELETLAMIDLEIKREGEKLNIQLKQTIKSLEDEVVHMEDKFELYFDASFRNVSEYAEIGKAIDYIKKNFINSDITFYFKNDNLMAIDDYDNEIDVIDWYRDNKEEI